MKLTILFILFVFIEIINCGKVEEPNFNFLRIDKLFEVQKHPIYFGKKTFNHVFVDQNGCIYVVDEGVEFPKQDYYLNENHHFFCPWSSSEQDFSVWIKKEENLTSSFLESHFSFFSFVYSKIRQYVKKPIPIKIDNILSLRLNKTVSVDKGNNTETEERLSLDVHILSETTKQVTWVIAMYNIIEEAPEFWGIKRELEEEIINFDDYFNITQAVKGGNTLHAGHYVFRLDSMPFSLFERETCQEGVLDFEACGRIHLNPQGRCLNGECVCNRGFYGAACELTSQEVCSLHGNRINDEFCCCEMGRVGKACEGVSKYANVSSLNTLACLFTEKDGFDSENEKMEDFFLWEEFSGAYLSFGLGGCGSLSGRGLFFSGDSPKRYIKSSKMPPGKYVVRLGITTVERDETCHGTNEESPVKLSRISTSNEVTVMRTFHSGELESGKDYIQSEVENTIDKRKQNKNRQGGWNEVEVIYREYTDHYLLLSQDSFAIDSDHWGVDSMVFIEQYQLSRKELAMDFIASFMGVVLSMISIGVVCACIILFFCMLQIMLCISRKKRKEKLREGVIEVQLESQNGTCHQKEENDNEEEKKNKKRKKKKKRRRRRRKEKRKSFELEEIFDIEQMSPKTNALPEGWEIGWDKIYKRFFYTHVNLPSNWQIVWKPNEKIFSYLNKVTGESSPVRPVLNSESDVAGSSESEMSIRKVDNAVLYSMTESAPPMYVSE